MRYNEKGELVESDFLFSHLSPIISLPLTAVVYLIAAMILPIAMPIGIFLVFIGRLRNGNSNGLLDPPGTNYIETFTCNNCNNVLCYQKIDVFSWSDDLVRNEVTMYTGKGRCRCIRLDDDKSGVRKSRHFFVPWTYDFKPNHPNDDESDECKEISRLINSTRK